MSCLHIYILLPSLSSSQPPTVRHWYRFVAWPKALVMLSYFNLILWSIQSWPESSCFHVSSSASNCTWFLFVAMLSSRKPWAIESDPSCQCYHWNLLYEQGQTEGQSQTGSDHVRIEEHIAPPSSLWLEASVVPGHPNKVHRQENVCDFSPELHQPSHPHSPHLSF